MDLPVEMDVVQPDNQRCMARGPPLDRSSDSSSENSDRSGKPRRKRRRIRHELAIDTEDITTHWVEFQTICLPVNGSMPTTDSEVDSITSLTSKLAEVKEERDTMESDMQMLKYDLARMEACLRQQRLSHSDDKQNWEAALKEQEVKVKGQAEDGFREELEDMGEVKAKVKSLTQDLKLEQSLLQDAQQKIRILESQLSGADARDKELQRLRTLMRFSQLKRDSDELQHMRHNHTQEDLDREQNKFADRQADLDRKELARLQGIEQDFQKLRDQLHKARAQPADSSPCGPQTPHRRRTVGAVPPTPSNAADETTERRRDGALTPLALGASGGRRRKGSGVAAPLTPATSSGGPVPRLPATVTGGKAVGSPLRAAKGLGRAQPAPLQQSPRAGGDGSLSARGHTHSEGDLAARQRRQRRIQSAAPTRGARPGSASAAGGHSNISFIGGQMIRLKG